MRVLLMTYGGRGDVEPLVALAVRLRERGAEVRVSAPPDCATRLAEVGVPLTPVGDPVRPLVQGASRPSPADVPRIAAGVIAAQFGNVPLAAEGCDALVLTGLLPAVAGARSVAEKLGISCVSVAYCPVFLPSPHHRPTAFPGRPFPPELTDNRQLWEFNSRTATELFGEALNSHRASVGLPPVDDVYRYAISDQPWLAADPTLGPWEEPTDLDVVQTGAWTLPDERPLPAELEAFLDAGEPPVYVGLGSMPAPDDFAHVAIDAIRAHGHRAVIARGWAELTPIDDRDDCFAIGEINHQALFSRVAAVVHHGGAGTTATAARSGAPQVLVPRMADQPYWATRVTTLGIGATDHSPTPTPESLSAAVGTALSPETSARAAEVARTIRTDGAAVAADLLLGSITR